MEFSEILQEPYFHAIIIAIDLVILVIGLVGNVITCVVIIGNKSMHTVPNCYLFNLAVSDLLLMISGLPAATKWGLFKYDFGKVGCFLRGWLSETSADVSILTITAFTFERYLAICRPITAQAMSKLSRAVKLIIVIWAVSLLCGLIVACQAEGPIADYDYRCDFTLTIYYSLDIMGLIFFVIPMVIITILYILIAKSLHKSEKMKGRLNNYPDRQSKSVLKMLELLYLDSIQRCNTYNNKKTYQASTIGGWNKIFTTLTVVIVVVFFICWAPYYIQRFLWVRSFEIENGKSDLVDALLEGLYYVSGIFYFFSGAINPIIYSIMSKKFRDAFKKTLLKSCFFKNEPAPLPKE